MSYGKSRVKSFARFFLFGIIATPFPAVACVLLARNVFVDPRKIAVTIAIICGQCGYFCIKFARRRRREKPESAAADAAAEPRTSIYWSTPGSIAGVICSTVLFFMVLPYILEIPPKAGRFDRARMEGLVAQVRNQKFSGDRRFYWADVSGTAALFSGTDELHWTTVPGTSALSTGTAAGYANLWAERTEDQKLKVTIWTNGDGHAPLAYGFAYSDVPLEPHGTPGNSLILFSSGPNETIAHQAASLFGVPGLHLMKRIDAHWWEVCSRD